MSNLQTYVDLATRRLGGLDLSKLPDGGLSKFVLDAVAEHALQRPRRVVYKFAGDGTDEYDLPATWIDGQSILDPVRGVRRVPGKDYNRPADYATEAEYALDRKSDGTPQLRLAWTPTAADDVVLEFSSPHVVDDSGSTIEPQHDVAIGDLTAALVLESKALALADVSIESNDVDLSLGDVSGRGGLLERAAARLRRSYGVGVGLIPPAGAEAATDAAPGSRIGHPTNDWRWGSRRPY